MDGAVLVDGRKVTKPGLNVPNESVIELCGGFTTPKYVGRGGLKLEKALDCFQVEAQGRICLDVGASTGGFTDCLLKHGAQLVYAVDVGYGQLDWSLRNHPRVVVKERINARYLSREVLYGTTDDMASLLVVDVSFISLRAVLPACLALLVPGADIVCLIKPQFEAGRHAVGKGGVVRDAETHQEVLETILQAGKSMGLMQQGLTHSPLKGPAGNIEFLVYWRSDGTAQDMDVPKVVHTAHQEIP